MKKFFMALLILFIAQGLVAAEENAAADAEAKSAVVAPKVESATDSDHVLTSLKGWYLGGEGFKIALEQQERDKLPFVAYYYNDTCKELCETFEKEVLTSKNFTEQLNGFGLLAVNADRDPDLANWYGVEIFPSILIFRSKSSAQKLLVEQKKVKVQKELPVRKKKASSKDKDKDKRRVMPQETKPVVEDEGRFFTSHILTQLKYLGLAPKPSEKSEKKE